MSLYSQSLGVAIPQCTCATDASSEIQALRQRLQAAELEGVLVQADSLIVVKHGLHEGFGLIRDQLTYSRIGPSRSERYSI